MAKKPEPAAWQGDESWNDNLAEAEPQRSLYFDAVRTDAYENKNTVSNYIEFWVALQTDKEQDKWRVMHYMMFDLDREDGKFRSEIAVRDKDGKPVECSLPEAIYHLNEFVSMAGGMDTAMPTEMTPERFPADAFPEIKVYYFDIENYKTAANILHIGFDGTGSPYRTIAGKVFATATFTRSEINKSILAAGQARANPKIAAKIEDGILSDIYNAASSPNASLKNIIKAGKMLTCLDDFAVQLGAFYLSLQKFLNKDDKFDGLQGLTPEEKKTLYARANPRKDDNATPSSIISYVLSQAWVLLEDAKKLGVHVEPFQKHLAECELYLHLLDASKNLVKYRTSLQSAHSADTNALAAIEKSVKAAQDSFIELGGTEEHFDRLQAWVVNHSKEAVPPWVTS